MSPTGLRCSAMVRHLVAPCLPSFPAGVPAGMTLVPVPAPVLELLTGLVVLVVEDTPEYQLVLRSVLLEAGCQVVVAPTLAEARETAATLRPDVVVLDVVLPDGSGRDLISDLRGTNDPYVLILSQFDGEADRIVGLSAGADDHLAKPFSSAELLARLAAGQRRVQRKTATAPVRTVGDITLDVNGGRVLVKGVEVTLTRTEQQLLVALVRHQHQVLSRDQLVQMVWGDGWYGEPRIVDTHLNNLRRKLRTAGADDPVRTVRGVGYRVD